MLAVSTLPLLRAQEAGTRAGEIEAARDAKQAYLSPDAPDKWERRLLYVKDARLIERFTMGYNGLRVLMGGMATGSGFAMGAQYYRPDLCLGDCLLSASLSGSTNQWVKSNFTFAAPRLAGGRLAWFFQAERHNYDSLSYYGSGPDSDREAETNYRLEDTSVDTALSFRPAKWLDLRMSGGYLFMNIGPGHGTEPSTDQVFGPDQAPGIDQQTNFFRYGPSLAINYLDSPAGPRSGGLYTLRFDRYEDAKSGLYSFSRAEVDLQQYFPLFNKRRVIALRAKSAWTSPAKNGLVPFYFQTVLGGGNDLRGYAPYRFYGDQMVLLNAEWRWEAFPALDVAFFADAGKVADDFGKIDLGSMETDVGFGFRFNVRNATFIRVDFAFSHEGFQVWFKFNDVYGKLPLGQSSPLHIY